MAIKTILFLLGFAVCAVGALFLPILGVLGYVVHYSVGPERQWWAVPIRPLDLRYAYTLAVMTAIGLALHWRSLRWGPRAITRQEWLLLAFLGVVWVSTLLSAVTEGSYTMVDHPSIKMTKAVIFVLLMTHILTTMRSLDLLTWALIGGAMILNLQAYTTPRSEFIGGRLEGIGGYDFADSNAFAAYLAALLPIIGVQVLRARWLWRVAYLVVGAFTINSIILTRSRGAVVGLACGAVAAALTAPKKHRAMIFVGLVLVAMGGLYLSDPAFLGRASTISQSEGEREGSAQGRVEIWETSVRILQDHPLGIGAGNFLQVIGRYNPKHVGRDAHNTFVRCYTELGIEGFVLLLAMVVSAFVMLRRSLREAQGLPSPHREQVVYTAYGFIVSLVIYLASAVTITVLYMETLWWFLALPVCLERAVANLKADFATALVPPAKEGARGAKTTPTKPKTGAAPVPSGSAR